ncbi:hypothetical protein [Aphanizomenon flos-aquae]|uniref:hypothetical protein n=1 Tax=Aphanizomenon flos-aquae TaxID=1176 RepID=UPI000AD40D6D|nr:hypothetical protein [Aphanizomenon flos-aquae]
MGAIVSLNNLVGAIARINHRIPHPVNPEILEILIWLAPRYAIRQFPTALRGVSHMERSEMKQFQGL